MSLRCSLPVSLFLIALVSGCVAPGMGGVSMNVTIAGGETVRIEFDRHGIVHGEDDDLRIDNAVLLPDFKAKEATYFFAFTPKHPLALRHVTVEDVSDDAPVTMADDAHPTLDEKHRWKYTTPRFAPDDSNARWLYQIDDNVRVYRFTVVTADGHTHVVYEGANYPAMIKRFFRQQMGLEKIDKR